MKDRTARMTVLTWQAPDAQSCNLLTFIRHRRRDALGPWTGEPDETWSSDDLGYELRLFSFDASFERCQALVDHVLDSGTLKIDGFEVNYALESTPRHHWAYRDDRPLTDASMRSPFSRHSAEIIEYWSFATEPRERWLEVLESLKGNLPPQLARLGFPLDQRPDRVGNLIIAGAEDAITCDLTAHPDKTLRLNVDANELLPKTYRATVWASHSGDEVLRQEIAVESDQTEIKLASDVDHIGFAIYRTSDGQCVDLMETFLIMGGSIRIGVDSGPPLHFRTRRNQSIHEAKMPSFIEKTNVRRSDEDSAKFDKRIRQQWFKRRTYNREATTRREGNFVRFRPDQFDQAVQHLIDLLRQDSGQTEPIYLADPYFMTQLKKENEAKLYPALFAATAGRPLRILCAKKSDAEPWWLEYPDQITAHVSVRAFFRQKMDEEEELLTDGAHNKNEYESGFHDRYLITSKHETIITHSISGWTKDGVTFARLPYNVYRAEAKKLWEMDIESTTADLFVQKIA